MESIDSRSMGDKILHHCNSAMYTQTIIDYKRRLYGEAIAYCYEYDDGLLIVENDEYVSQVNYCPYCGYKAKVTFGKIPPPKE